MELYKLNYISKFVYWAPRVLSILFILFLMMFSLDIFEPGLNAKEIAIGLFIHNIPALILLIVIIISWKYEIIGGIVFIFAGLVYIGIRLASNRLGGDILLSSLIIAGPSFLIGILYILNWIKKRNQN